MPRVREAALGLLLAASPMIVLVLLILVPAIEAVRFSLGFVPTGNASYATGRKVIMSDTPTLAVYRNLFASPFFQDDLRLTATVVASTVILVLVVGYVLALYVRFGTGVLPSVARSLYLTPMFVPVVIASYALIAFFGNHGVLDSWFAPLHLPYISPIYHMGGIVLGHVWTGIPFAVLMLGAGLDAVPEEMIEAARDIGAGFDRVLWRVVLPMNVVPTLIVATFTFIGVLGSYTVPYLLGANAPQALGVAMQAYFGSYQQPQTAVAIAVCTFVIAAAAGAVYIWATAREGKARG